MSGFAEEENCHRPAMFEPFVDNYEVNMRTGGGMARSGDLTMTFPSWSFLLSWKQSTIPGISLMTVFAQVRSTNPTSNNLGISAPNLAAVVSDLFENTSGFDLLSAVLCTASL